MKKTLLSIALSISLTPAIYANSSQTIRISNGGEQTLTLGSTPISFAWSNGQAYTPPSIGQGTCANANLTHGQTCEFSISAQPNSDLTSPQSGTITITSNNSPAIVQTLPITIQPQPTPSVDGLRIFVTNSMGNGNISSWNNAGGLSGLEAADNICMLDASNPALGTAQASKFKAWLSTSAVNAKDHVNLQIDGSNAFTEKYVNLNGETVFAEGQIFGNSDLQNTIDITGISYYPHTGTYPNGTFTGHSCNDWQHGTNNTYRLTWGLADAVNTQWTNNTDNNSPSFFCQDLAPIYCFETP